MINTTSKIISLLLLATLTHSKTVDIDWIIPADEQPFPNPDPVKVGDKVSFVWPVDSPIPHNVFIHPSGTCNQDFSKYIGANPEGTEYTFQEKDSGKEITFVCNIGNPPDTHCTRGQIIKFTVEEMEVVADESVSEDEMEVMCADCESPDFLDESPDLFAEDSAGFVWDGRIGVVWGTIMSLLYVALW